MTALLNAASLARETPAVFVVEDAHWIDEVSESMIADFLTVIPQTPSLVLVTYRPEYDGALARVHGAQTIALGPLSDSETAALVAELLGPDPSTGALGHRISQRAAGNPFFVEEIVRELAERGVLQGQTGAYVSTADVSEAKVPVTLQATIAARIDRLDPAAKRTLNAAAVIGTRFSGGLLETLGIDPALQDLVAGELIDQITFTRQPEYVFHHPLIRAVAYEAQLKSDRAELHRRLAAAIESRDPTAAEENAALIAGHVEAAGDLHAAYGWHMRAATWATNRDINAGRLSWERAVEIADALPAEDPNRLAMRIAPRTMLCGTAWRVHDHAARDRFDELRQLCTAAGDKASLAIGMTGLAIESLWSGRVDEASRLASEQMALLESIGDPSLTIGVAFLSMAIRFDTGDFADIFRWSQTVIDWADGDPAKGNLIVGSPLAVALVWRGVARFWLGREGWRQDLDDAVAMARRIDPATYAMVVSYKYGFGIGAGVLLADDTAVREIEDAVQTAEGSSDDTALTFAKLVWGITLVPRRAPADRQRGQELLAQLRDRWVRERSFLHWLPAVDLSVARERAARGDRDGAIPIMRQAVDDLFSQGEFAYLTGANATLVQTLLDRGANSDLAEAQEAIDRLANLPGDEGWVLRDITLLQLRALLARAHGDDTAYRDFRDRYRDIAKTLGYEGHIGWAEAMP